MNNTLHLLFRKTVFPATAVVDTALFRSPHTLTFKKGESFETVAMANSQDPSVAENKGNLGYFTSFKINSIFLISTRVLNKLCFSGVSAFNPSVEEMD